MRDPDECNTPCYKATLVARVQKRLPPEEELQGVADLLGLLADPTRLKIIAALAATGELCACDVAHVLGISAGATSEQLCTLRAAGLITQRDDGHMVYYQLQDDRIADLATQARDHLDQTIS